MAVGAVISRSKLNEIEVSPSSVLIVIELSVILSNLYYSIFLLRSITICFCK